MKYQKRYECCPVWRSKNPVNELVYGYGGVKLLPTKLTLDMDCVNRYDNPLATDSDSWSRYLNTSF